MTCILQLTDLHLMSDADAELKGVCTRARAAFLLGTGELDG